jgi:DNA-3-methyladenine glycosylase I
MTKTRCAWTAGGNEAMTAYHDSEWGVPVREDRVLFEFLTLEGAQAGLSWSTILNKRQNYRQAFAAFDPKKVARYDRRTVTKLLRDPGIVRNRLKVESTVENAKRILEVQKEFGSFADYVWTFVGGRPIQNRWRSLKDLPPKTEQSTRMSTDLRKRGFRFVGPTICYAFMQAVGMVNDHETRCFRHSEVKKLR